MYITDLVTEFKTTYDLGGIGLPGYEDVEIKKLLEINQYKLISQKIGGNNVYNSKFPDTNKRIDDLQGLIGDSNSVTYGTAINNTYLIVLPSDYLHLVEIRVVYSDSFVELAKPMQLATNIRYNAGRNNQLPYVKNPVYSYMDSSGGNRRIRLFPTSEIGAATLSDINVVYIKKPVNMEVVADITVLTDFNDDVYHELVAMTVDQAIDIASPNKSQISKQTLKQAE